MKLINPFIILRILSIILLIETISFLSCLPVALIYEESLLPFLWSSIIVLILSRFLYFLTRKVVINKITNREGFLAVTLSWFAVILFGTLPFILSGSISSFTDAFFESCSGFTTTGSSILNDIEALPFSILFWRSLTHWIGGLGIIGLMIIILPSLNITGYQLFSMESSLKEKIHPRTRSIGFRILFIYLGLTVAEIIFLYGGEMNLFDSICHSFGTIATGGFSTKNSSIVNFSPYSQYIITLFMFLSGVSFVVYYYLMKLRFRRISKNEELRFYIASAFFAVVIATSLLYVKSDRPFEPVFRESTFQVVSVLTCTGYSSADYLEWPQTGIMLLFFLMFAGGCTGSTSGGIKMARHLIGLKNIRYIFVKLIHPKAIYQIKLNEKSIPEKSNISIISFIVLYLFIFFIGTIVVVIIGSDPVSASGAVAASMANLGPGLGSVGPMSNYAHLPYLTKIVLCLLMVIGRLEIYTVFILFTRSFWKL
ncbi:MAG: TrkH family potassium uptake protein [Bacteroidales bacterium]